LKKLVIILLLLLGIGYSNNFYAQSGGRKKEKRIKTKRRGNHILTQYKSHGHADEFARGSNGRRGRIARLFHKTRPSWVYKSSGSRRSHARDNRDLFTRDRSKGHVDNDMTQARQNRERGKRRDHGNSSFKRKKYRR
jgi:hypothetical protein